MGQTILDRRYKASDQATSENLHLPHLKPLLKPVLFFEHAVQIRHCCLENFVTTLTDALNGWMHLEIGDQADTLELLAVDVGYSLTGEDDVATAGYIEARDVSVCSGCG